MRTFNEYESMAMLDLPELERARLKERFNEITSGFSALDAFDTSEVEPLVSVLDFNSVLREDEAEKFISRDELLKNAPEQHDGYFQVPATID